MAPSRITSPSPAIDSFKHPRHRLSINRSAWMTHEASRSRHQPARRTEVRRDGDRLRAPGARVRGRLLPPGERADVPRPATRHRARGAPQTSPSCQRSPLPGGPVRPAGSSTESRRDLRALEGRGLRRRMFLARLSRPCDLAEDQRGLLAREDRAESAQGSGHGSTTPRGGLGGGSHLGTPGHGGRSMPNAKAGSESPRRRSLGSTLSFQGLSGARDSHGSGPTHSRFAIEMIG